MALRLEPEAVDDGRSCPATPREAGQIRWNDDTTGERFDLVVDVFLGGATSGLHVARPARHPRSRAGLVKMMSSRLDSALLPGTLPTDRVKDPDKPVSLKELVAAARRPSEPEEILRIIPRINPPRNVMSPHETRFENGLPGG